MKTRTLGTKFHNTIKNHPYSFRMIFHVCHPWVKPEDDNGALPGESFEASIHPKFQNPFDSSKVGVGSCKS